MYLELLFDFNFNIDKNILSWRLGKFLTVIKIQIDCYAQSRVEPFLASSLTNYGIADDTDNALSHGASLKLYRERNPTAHRMRRIQILIKTRTYRVLRKRPRRYARRLSRTNGGISNGGENVHQPRRRRRHRGWSAVSSSLEPSPPTGHYCLVPYSVTNCFIKLKSHNPHCTASRRPCASTLPSTHPLRVPFALLAPLYIRAHMPHRTVCDPLDSAEDVPLDCPSQLPTKIFSSLFFPI